MLQITTGLAISDYHPAASIAQIIIASALQQSILASSLLNVNIPMLPEDQIKGFRTARLSLRLYRDRLDRRVDPRGRPYYWIGGDTPTGISEEGTDVGALLERYVSITPLQSDLTAYNAIEQIGKRQAVDNNMVTNRLPILNHTLLHR